MTGKRMLTPESVAALERWAALAGQESSVPVDKGVLAELIAAWRNWQMVEALPRYQALEHDCNLGMDVWWVEDCHMGTATPVCGSPAAALAAALGRKEEG